MNFGMSVQVIFYAVPLMSRIFLTQYTIDDLLNLILVSSWCTLYCVRTMYVSNECTSTAFEVTKTKIVYIQVNFV